MVCEEAIESWVQSLVPYVHYYPRRSVDDTAPRASPSSPADTTAHETADQVSHCLSRPSPGSAAARKASTGPSRPLRASPIAETKTRWPAHEGRPPSPIESEPPAKRRRIRRTSHRSDHRDTSPHPHAMPDAPETPPSLDSAGAGSMSTLPMSNLSVANAPTLHPGHKRGGESLDASRDDLEQTPKAPRRQGTRSGSPPKRQRTLNEIFHTIEKPIQTKSLKSGRSLPSDVSALYSQIQTAGLMIGILPCALRSVGTFSQLPDIQFRTPEQDQELGITDGFQLNLAVRKIVRASLESENVKRLESGWNFLVHAPVLNLIFESEPLLDEEDEDYDEALETQVPPVTARWEAIMGATITAEAKPAPQSASVGSASTRSASSDLGSLYNRSDSKKVDFAVLLQLNPREQGLRQAIAEAGFVNQTVSQLNLLDNPIAVSIETKGSEGSGDAIAQLGVWAAAWHKRMLALRHFRFPPIPRAYLPPAQPGNAQPPGSGASPAPRRLVTVLLVKVVAHDWFLYFSCDRGSFIEILGPLKLGSTVSVQDTYVLLTSLAHIRKWVETAFFDGIRSWFMDE